MEALVLANFKACFVPSPRKLNIFGLLLGFAGCLVIFFYGPPQPSFERGISLGLELATPLGNGQTVAEHNLNQEALENQYRIMSHIGLGLVTLGFLFQLMAAMSKQVESAES